MTDKPFDFEQACIEVLRRYGAAEIPDSGYGFELATAAGRICISPRETWVAMRFDDPDMANRTRLTWIKPNPHSGKWNFHPAEPTAEAVTEFENRIKSVLCRHRDHKRLLWAIGNALDHGQTTAAFISRLADELIGLAGTDPDAAHLGRMIAIEFDGRDFPDDEGKTDE